MDDVMYFGGFDSATTTIGENTICSLANFGIAQMQ
jgi:hypothetical protein